MTAFDPVAARYDEDLARQAPVFERFRVVIRAALARHVPADGWVMDLGCGTGADTFHLAERGNHVLAVDPSVAMLEGVAARARDRGLADRIRPLQARAGELAQRWPADAPPLSGVVSSLGPLNGEADLRPVARHLAAVLPAGAALVLSPMARVCPWEIGLHLLRGDPRRALARLAPGGVPVPVSEGLPGITQVTWFPSSRAVVAAFAQGFELVEQRALGVILPPPWWARARAHPRMLEAASRLEDAVAHRWPLRGWGDHTLFVLIRRR